MKLVVGIAGPLHLGNWHGEAQIAQQFLYYPSYHMMGSINSPHDLEPINKYITNQQLRY